MRGGSLDAPGQAKVAHFEVAVRVKQKVGRFQVPMDDVRAMNRLERPQNLIYEVLPHGDQMGVRYGRRGSRRVPGSDHQSTAAF